MSNQIAGGLEALNLNSPNSTAHRDYRRTSSTASPQEPVPHLSPFPRLINPPPNVPPTDDEVEATLENARLTVLNSNDPDMQLAWAADALVYVGVCQDNEERIAAAKPHAARTATPRIEHQLKADAMNIVTFLADQHHPKAEFLKGMWLEWGRHGQREDKKEAFRCYSRSADRGYARAEYRIGMLYESYNDPAKALRHYHQGVDAGDAASCYRLGMMTLRGQHAQPQDFAKAIDLIRRSAEAADENAAQGAYVYGMLLARQLPQIEIPDGFLPQDERAGRMNIEKSAYLKFAKAQLKMGMAYELGSLGCDFSPALSMHYYALAAKQGEAEAEMGLSKWFLVGSEGLFPKNEELAYTYAERAAHSGLANAEFAMGYFNEIGVHTPVNLDKALDWYRLASEHGNTDAQGRIESLKKKQYLNRHDHEQVAISRIKSQYGSVRRQPPRNTGSQQQPSGLGQSTSADDLAGSRHPSSSGSYPKQTAPPRGQSITPYPVSDQPPAITSGGRASSVAPYPLEDGPPSRTRPSPHLGPTASFSNPTPLQRPATAVNPVDMRPSSAFQINPDLRSNSVAPVPQYPSQGGRPPPQNYDGYTQPAYGRPMTAQPYPPGPGYQGGPPMRPPQQRVASGPAVMMPHQQGMNGGPRPGSAQPPVPGKASHPNTASMPQQQTPKLDIGYSAPPEARPPPTQYGPHPGAGRPIGRGAGHGPRPQQQAAPAQRHSPQPATGSGRPPAMKDSSSKPSMPTQASAPKPSPTPPATGKHNSKPQKGPKTFDEMGVPAQKQGEDCVVM